MAILLSGKNVVLFTVFLPLAIVDTLYLRNEFVGINENGIFSNSLKTSWTLRWTLHCDRDCGLRMPSVCRGRLTFACDFTMADIPHAFASNNFGAGVAKGADFKNYVVFKDD